MRRLRIGIGITAAAILCACGSPGATGLATPSPVASATPSPSPSPQPPLVIVRSLDGKNIFVESFADPTQPVTLYSLSPAARNARFISRTEIGYAINTLPDSPTAGVTEIWRMSLTDMRPVSVAKLKGSSLDFAWSPDGSSLAYLAQTEVPSDANQLWLKVGAAAPRALTPSIPLYGREFIDTDQITVRFSHDGAYLLMVDTGVAGHIAPASADSAHFQVRSVPDGKLVWVPPLKGSWTTMAAWSNLTDRLYFNDADVQTWDAPMNIVRTLAGNLIWYSPSISPDDGFVAYGVEANDGKPHLEVRNLVSGSVRVLAGVRGQPTFLSDEAMIEAHFTRNTSPIPSPAYIVSSYFVLNLLTNAETPLLGTPIDVWVS